MTSKSLHIAFTFRSSTIMLFPLIMLNYVIAIYCKLLPLATHRYGPILYMGRATSVISLFFFILWIIHSNSKISGGPLAYCLASFWELGSALIPVHTEYKLRRILEKHITYSHLDFILKHGWISHARITKVECVAKDQYGKKSMYSKL